MIREAVTTGEFILLIWEEFCRQGRESEETAKERGAFGRESAGEPPEELWPRGRRKGWLEEQDLLEAQKAIERRTAARIVREFLRKEWGEADEPDWETAKALKDLYDCRTCVDHIAQVYAKGIMTGTSEGIFGGKEHLSSEEAVAVAERIFDRNRRIRPETRRPEAAQEGEDVRRTGTQLPIRKVSAEQAAGILQRNAGALLVDVRTRQEYERNHPEGACNFPFGRILEAPGEVAADRDAVLLLYCDGGYRSEIAAGRLLEAGYRNVFVCTE